ncbi:hypothetical protein H5410_002240 [Solanum commersonii]|uniref:Uncharacterized protein n=1 Tax=Solanum commersonii TaxID=4109 RepID=A0A9J6B1S8_SOLCO|nr:hypothetical protein H5410_002240 [Solanum commersonii]
MNNYTVIAMLWNVYKFLLFNFLNNIPKKAFDPRVLSITLESYLFNYLKIDLTKERQAKTLLAQHATKQRERVVKEIRVAVSRSMDDVQLMVALSLETYTSAID